VNNALGVYVGHTSKNLQKYIPDFLVAKVLPLLSPRLQFSVEIAALRILQHYVQGLGFVIPEIPVALDDVWVMELLQKFVLS